MELKVGDVIRWISLTSLGDQIELIVKVDNKAGLYNYILIKDFQSTIKENCIYKNTSIAGCLSGKITYLGTNLKMIEILYG